MATQVSKTVTFIMATVKSHILCHLSIKMIYGLKSQAFADSELSEYHNFKSVDRHKPSLQPRFEV